MNREKLTQMEDTKSVGQFLQFVISSSVGILKSFKLRTSSSRFLKTCKEPEGFLREVTNKLAVQDRLFFDLFFYF